MSRPNSDEPDWLDGWPERWPDPPLPEGLEEYTGPPATKEQLKGFILEFLSKLPDALDDTDLPSGS